MKILLINPPSEFLEQAYGVKQKVSFGHAPPLGLGYIAAYLEQDGHDVSILDASAHQMSIGQTLDAVADFGPELVGLSVLTNYASSAAELSSALKERFPDVTTLLGGAHATYFYEDILHEMPGIDHVIYGEADLVINDYVRALGSPDKLSQVKSLVYRNAEGEVCVNDAAPLVEDMDSIPFPAWHLFDFSLYRPLPLQYKQEPFFTMITSRGCWWRKCKFCFQAGKKAVHYRRQSPQRVVDEVEILYHRYGIREIAFWDDTFIMNLSWLKEFKRLLEERELNITWVASGRVNTMNREIIQTIHDAGCWSMFIGVESGNQDLLDMIEKGINLTQVREIFSIANDVGIETRAAFMLGLPGETPSKAQETIDLAREIDPTYAVFYATHPRYGTLLHDIAMNSGKVLDEQFRGMSKVTYIPEGYEDHLELEKVIRKAYRSFYIRPRFVFKILKKMRTLRDIKELAYAVALYLGLTRNKVA